MEIDSIKIGPVAVEEIVDLRHAVLRGVAEGGGDFPGDGDSTTVHLAAKDGEDSRGLRDGPAESVEGRPACQLRGMAVDSAYQRRGVGGRLLAEIRRDRRRKMASD